MKQLDARNSSIRPNHQAASVPGAWRNVLEAVEVNWPASRWQDVGVVVGCSGGGDSVALLLALHQQRDPTAKGFLVAAHFNHRQRGQQSNGDERFVRELAQQLNIRFVADQSGNPAESSHSKADPSHPENDGTSASEASMRDERHRFLKETAHQSGARYLALAHSADDQVETVLHHLIRGTGPAGLAGIAPTRPLKNSEVVLVRPLLTLSHQELRDGLQSIDQCWREDSSNRQLIYRRNWIRHRILPAISEKYPESAAAIGRAAAALRQWKDVMDSLADQWLDQHVSLGDPTTTTRTTTTTTTTAAVTICRDPQTAAAIVVVALQRLWNIRGWSQGEMGQPHWDRLAKTIAATTKVRYQLPGAIDVDATGTSVKLSTSREPSQLSE